MILFHDDIKKGIGDAPNVALMKLRAYLNTKEPELVYFLQTHWDRQQRAITYKELREALMQGYITEEMLEEWHKDYSKFVTDYVAPMWVSAMVEANKELETRYPIYSFDPASKGVKAWTDNRSAEFVTKVVDEQKKAIRELIKRAAQIQDVTVDELSHAIRPMIGLNHRQTIANINYYHTMIESGMSKQKAKERSIRYSARQSRYRGYMVARTELAFAYNQGQHLGVKQAIEEGLMGRTVKVWCTADDERTCDSCGALEGKEIEMDDDFTYEHKGQIRRINPGLRDRSVGKVPPAHPSCRCTIIYLEKEPPKIEASSL